MAPAIEKLRDALAKTPGDRKTLKAFGDACLAAGDLRALRSGLEPILNETQALAGMASEVAATLERGAAESKLPRDAAELYLRAAKLWSEVGDERLRAAKALAAAWQHHPSARVGNAALALLDQPDFGDAPDYLLVALSQVGPEALRVRALRRLGARHLDERRLEDAESVFRALTEIRPDDADATQGLARIAAMRKEAAKDLASARKAAAKAKDDDAAGALTRLGDAQAAAGATADAETAYRDAIAAGPALEAEAALESLLRETGRLDDLRALWESLLTQVPKERQVVLRRRLYRLVHDDLGDKVGARRYLVMGHATAPADAEAVIARARAAGEAGDWNLAVQLLEDASAAPNKETKTAVLIEQARILEEEMGDLPGAERVFRRVRVTDPRSLTALMFYRRWYAEHDAPRRAYANLAQLYAILTGDELASERIEVATEMAKVAEVGLKSYDKAIDAWRRVARERPGDATVYSELRRLYSDAGRWHALIEHLEGGIRALAEAEPDKVEARVELLFEIIGIYQDPAKLPMEQMVVKTYERIVNLSPTNIQALDGLAGGLEEREKWAELVQVLARRVEVTTEPDELLALFSDIADLYLERIRSDVQAIGILERILELTPDDLGVIRKLRDIYRRRHDSEELYLTYQRELALLDGDEQLETLIELANLATEPLFRPEEAVRWWRAVLAIDPRNEAGQQALQDLHAEQKDWDGYVTVLEERLSQTKTRKQKVEVLLELGEIVYSRLGDAPRAQAIFTQIAELSPFNTTARSFLQRLYVSRRGWDELRALYAPRDDWRGYIEILQEYGERTDDPPLVADIQREIADVMETHLEDATGAVRHLELALASAPERVEVARLLADRYTARTAAPKQVAAKLTLAKHSEDAEERWRSWTDVAALETKRKRPSEAFDAWAQAVVAGAALGDVASVSSLLAQASQTGRWEDAYAALQDGLGQVDADDVPTRLVFHEQLGDVAANRLMRHAEAADQFKWVLQLAPGHPVALDALEKIYFSQNDFEGLEEVFKARADAATDPEERVTPLRRLGQLYEDVLVDGQRAAQTYQEVLAITPEDDDALEALVRVLEVEEAHSDLAQALETALTRIEDLDRRHAVQIRLANLYAGRLDQPEAAVDHYADVVEHRGEDASTEIKALERLFEDPRSRGAAAPVLETVYRRREDAGPLVKALEARLATSENVTEQAGMLDEVAMLSESALADPEAAFTTMGRRFALTPAERDTWSEQHRLAELTNEWEALAEQWRTQIDAGPTKGFDQASQHALRIALADIYSRKLFEVEDAVAQVEIVERESPDETVVLNALELLEVLYKRAADLEGYVRVKLLAADRVSNRPARRQKILDAATVLAGPLGRAEEAIKHVRALLDEDPSSFDVAEALAGLYETKGELESLDTLYETWIGLTESPELLDELHYRRAMLRRDRLDAWELAIDEFVGLIASPVRGLDARQALLEIARAQESANQRSFILEALSEHYKDAKNPEGQLAVLLVRADFAQPGAPRAAVLRQAAQQCLPTLDAKDFDPDAAQNAFDLYTQALYEAPGDADALAALMVIAERLETWEGLAEALSACAEQAQPTDAAQLWQREAEVAEVRLDDIPRAVAAWRQHLRLSDEGAEISLDAALVALNRLFESLGDNEARLDVLARQRAATNDEAIIMALASERAAILEQQDRLPEAIDIMHDAYNAVRDVAGLREEASTHLETLLTSAERHADVVTLVLNHADAVGDGDASKLLKYRAAELAEERAEDLSSAVDIYKDILLDDSTDETALAELTRLHGELEDWTAQATILERRLALSSDGDGESPETQAYRLALGDLYATPLDRINHAIHMFHAVLEVEPNDTHALDALHDIESRTEHGPQVRTILSDVFRDSGDDEALASLLTKIIANGDGAHDLGGLHEELALLNRDSLEVPDQAWRHGAAAYRLAPTGPVGEARRRIILDMATRYGRMDALAPLLLEVAKAIEAPALRLKRRLDDLEAMKSAGADEGTLLPFWRGVLGDDPRHPEALDEVETWARVQEDRDLLIEVLRLRLASIEDPVARVPVQLDLAEMLAQDTEALPEAAEQLAGILAVAPDHASAFAQLSSVYAALSEPEKLAGIIVARRPLVDAEARIGLTKQLAKLQWRELDAPELAVGFYREVLEAAPDDTEALASLEGIWGEGKQREPIFRVLEPHYERKEDWNKLVALYSSTLEKEGESELQQECLVKMARLESVRLDRPGAAYRTLKELADRLDDPDAHLDELEALAERANEWPDLVAFYEARVAGGRASTSMLARLAKALEEKVDNPERAIHFYRFALERDADNSSVRRALESLLRRGRRWEELVAVLLRVAEETKNEDDRVALSFSAAKLLDESLVRPRDAIDVLEEIVAIRPNEPQAHEAIIGLLERIEDYEALHAQYRQWLEAVPTDTQAVEIQVRLGRSLARFPETAREGLKELEDVLGSHEDHPGVRTALFGMLERAARVEAGDKTLEPEVAAATADAATLLETVLEKQATPEQSARIVAAQLRQMPASPERQATLVRLGKLLTGIGEADAAFARYAEALRADIGNAELEALLEGLATDHKQWPQLVSLYEACAATKGTPELVKHRYLLKIGNILHDNLNQPEEAVVWYERLLEQQPGNEDALAPLAKHYQSSGDAANEARVLAQWIELAAEDDEATALRRRLAVVRMDQLGDLVGAIEALHGTLPEGAADREIVTRLERLYVKTGNFDALVALYGYSLGYATDDAQRLELFAKMAQVHETRRDDLESARDACRQMLALDGHHRFALTSLERVERRLERWDAVDEVLGMQIEAATKDEPRAKLLVDRAELAFTQRSDPTAALGFLTEADELAGPGAGPDHLIKGLELLLRGEDVRLSAARRLQRRYKARKAWPRLVNALMIEHNATTAPEQRVTLAARAAEVAEKKLEDLGVALRVLLSALRQNPESMKLRRMATEVAERSGDWDSLAATADAIFEHFDDGELIRDVALWIGPIHWVKRSDEAAAIGAFERALEVDPHNKDAITALDELYVSTSDWRGQRKLLERQLDTASDAERQVIRLRVAELVAEHESGAAAVPLLKDLLYAHPDDEAALALLASLADDPEAGAAAAEILEPIYRSGEQWTALVALLDRRADAVESPEAKAALWMGAGVIYETSLNDPITALKRFARAALSTPDDRAPLKQFERVGFTIGAWDELVRVLSKLQAAMSDPTMRRDVLLHLAQINETRLDQPQDAIDNLQDVLTIEPDHKGALVGLRRLSKDDLERFGQATVTLADVEDNIDRAMRLWDELYEVAEAAESVEWMVTSCEAMLALSPGHPEATARLLPLREASGDVASMVSLLRHRMERVENAGEHAALKLQLARLLEGPLENMEAAIEAYEEAWELDPTLHDVPDRLEAYHRENEDWNRVVAVLRLRMERSEDAEEIARTRLSVAQVTERQLKHPDEAIRAYLEVLEESPDEVQAIDGLVGLYAKLRRFRPLAKILVRKSEVVGADKAAQRSALLQAAAVYLDQLDDTGAADALLDKILAADDGDAEALLLRARLRTKEEAYDDAGVILQQLVGDLEGKRKQRILLELAQLELDHLDMAEEALAHVLEAREIDASDPTLQRILPTILEKTGSWKLLSELLAADYEAAESEDERAGQALALARLSNDHLDDDAAFSLWLARAEAHAPESLEVAELAIAYHTRLEEWDEVAPRLERLVDDLHKRKLNDRLPMRAHELGMLYERLDKREAALTSYRLAHEADGTYTPNLVDYGRLLVEEKSWHHALKVHQNLLMQKSKLADPTVEHNVLYRLALASYELGQKPRAQQYLKRLKKADPKHAQAANLTKRIGD